MTQSAAPPVTTVSGTGISIRGNDIDTDQIIPARFMKVVSFEGLGQFAFFDQRFDEADEPKEHPFNDPRFKGASILVVNANFGCGSSREHAPQALMRWGIDAVVGESFAEIFAGNCLAMGIPTVTANTASIKALQDYIDENPDGEITVAVADETVTYDDTAIDANIDDARREALIEGAYDTTSTMLANGEQTEAVAASLPYLTSSHD